MKKKLSRLFRPGLTVCFIVMACFIIATLARGQYTLAIAEFFVTAALVVFYVLDRQRRSREILAFVRDTFQTQDISEKRTENPLPMAMVRLGDGGVVWASDRFTEVTGCRASIPEQSIGDVLPGMTMDWLGAGKNEYPNDVTIGSRRYRVYGTIIHNQEHIGVMLGMIYLSDLTEMYQVLQTVEI